MICLCGCKWICEYCGKKNSTHFKIFEYSGKELKVNICRHHKGRYGDEKDDEDKKIGAQV